MTVVFVVGQAEHRLDVSAGAELLESATQWAFVSAGRVVLVPRRVFPKVKDELAAHPEAAALIRSSGSPFTQKTPLRTRILAGAVLTFALLYFALMLFGLLAKAGIVQGFGD